LELVDAPIVIANGKPVAVQLPCTLHDFLLGQKLLPRSVVVEHNGEALAPSQFAARELNPGDRLELVKIVAGG
jgi:thiamine biosynthesis protein ThiS